MNCKKIEMHRCIETLNERSASAFLILLICGDLAFIVLHCINIAIPTMRYRMLEVSTDRGYPEMYQYIKFFYIIILLIYFSLKNKSLHYLAWALFFTYLLLDDSLEIHETIGGLIAAHLHIIPLLGLRLQDYGELMTSITVLAFLSPFLILAYKSGSQMFKKVSNDLILLLLVLIFFGVFVDVVVSALIMKVGKMVRYILVLVEDGGEMLSLSLILWCAFLHYIRWDNAGCYLCDLIKITLKMSYD